MAQQHREGPLVEHEAGGGDDEEAPRGAPRRRTLVGEGHECMATEGRTERDQPAADVGQQRRPREALDERDDDAPVHGRRDAAHEHEGGHAPAAVHGARSQVAPLASETPAASLIPAPRRIVVCIDDVGLHGGVNAAALELGGAARVSALSLLAGGPAFAAAAAALRDAPPRGVELGLHLDLCEFPLLPRTQRPLWAWMLRAALGRSERELLRREITAQLDAFESALGRPPDFVDGHRHVHQLGGVREVLLEVLGERFGSRRPWLRNSRPRLVGLSLKAALIDHAGARRLESIAAATGWRQNARLLGIYDFRGGLRRYEALVARWLHAADDGDLVMCHPSARVPEGDTAAADPLLAARGAEYAFWSSPAAAAALARERVVVQPLGAIAAGPAATQ